MKLRPEEETGWLTPVWGDAFPSRHLLSSRIPFFGPSEDAMQTKSVCPSPRGLGTEWPDSLGPLSFEPLLYHGVRDGLFHQPLWANKRQSQGLRGRTAVSPNRVQAQHQPVQGNSLLSALPAQPVKGRAWGQTDRSETSSSPNTGGCLAKRSF